jgi:hypothetical protein
MGAVYRNAYLTIAASSASSDSEDFLQARPPKYRRLDVLSCAGQESIEIYLPQAASNSFDND